MKSNLILGSFGLALAFCASAQEHSEECFRPGTSWIIDRASVLEGTNTKMTVSLVDPQNIGGFECSRMVILDADAQESEFIGYIRSEENKVFFLENETVDDWKLFYDFSLLPGEETIVWTPLSKRTREMKVKCLEIIQENGLEIMKMEGFEEGVVPELSSSTTEFEWFKNIGSSANVLLPFTTASDLLSGTGFKLAEVLYNGEIIYSANTNSIKTISKELACERIDERTIRISQPVNKTDVRVYDLNGNAIASFDMPTDEMIVSLPMKGLYFIVTENEVYKILI